jgi:hypothetical protein
LTYKIQVARWPKTEWILQVHVLPADSSNNVAPTIFCFSL